ncbi:MAG TPA: hypothetical protein VM639_06615 [Dongiaceae bacterium]|nr:hypothetical protein [Dongiaceae bacterium]
MRQSLHILSPQNNLRLIRNPELPADLSSLALKVSVASGGEVAHPSGKAGSDKVPATQVLWYIDGKPFQLAAASETLRWPLQPGLHEFQARVPYSKLASPVVTVQVQ